MITPSGILVVRDNPDIEILGTVELVPGCARIGEAWLENGELHYEFDGGTEMYWDGSMTVTKGGLTAFQDEDGREYAANELAIMVADGTLIPINEQPGARVILGDDIPAITAEVLAAGDELASLLDEAVSTHIYDFDNGDEQPADCAYKLAAEAWERARASAGPEATGKLIEDLWWFIENVDADAADRQDRFFALRERVRSHV